MGLISGIMTRTATSRAGQGFYKYFISPKRESFLNNTLPTLESILTGGIYIWSTNRQKNLSDHQKKLLNISNGLNTILGVTIGTIANRAVSKFGNMVVPYINKESIPKVHKVITGLKIALPLAATCLIMRYGLSTITPLISSCIMDKKNKKKALNLKA